MVKTIRAVQSGIFEKEESAELKKAKELIKSQNDGITAAQQEILKLLQEKWTDQDRRTDVSRALDEELIGYGESK